jgi:hypothetical protein
VLPRGSQPVRAGGPDLKTDLKTDPKTDPAIAVAEDFGPPSERQPRRFGPDPKNPKEPVVSQQEPARQSDPVTAALRVSVVIPARNEARNLPHVLAALPGDLHEVILVDGNSTDDTIAVAQRCLPSIRVVQQTRKGKGNALACGFAVVTGDVVVMLDADGSADPGEIPAFVAALVAGAHFAKGTRFAAGGASHDITRFRRVGNFGLNSLVNILYGTRYTDLCYGYNVFWAHLIPALELPPVRIPGTSGDDMVWGDGFEIETLINVRVAAAGAQITEVGSVEKQRLYGESNLNAVSDGLRVLRTIFAERRRTARQRRDGQLASVINLRPEVIDLRDGVVRQVEETVPGAWDPLRGASGA